MWRRSIDAIVGLACCLLLASCVFAININDLPWEVRNALKPVHLDPRVAEEDLRPVPGIRNVADLQPRLAPVSIAPGLADGAGADTGGKPGVLEAVEQPAGDKGLEGFDPHVLAMGGKCADTVRQENMSIEEFVAWTHENNLTKDDIVAAMQYSGMDWPQLDPESMPLAAALLDRIGDNLEGIDEFPMVPRLLLATYLGKLGRDDDVRRVYAAITDAELKTHSRRELHAVNSHTWRDAPVVSLDILKRYAEVLSERRLLCLEFRMSCALIADKTIVEKELIPFAQEALEAMPPTDYWATALNTLIWGFQYLGDDESAVREGMKWMQNVEALGVNTESKNGLYAKIRLAQSCAKAGRVAEAIDMLRAVADGASADAWLREAARAQLVEVAKTHPDISAAALSRPRFERVFPDKLVLRVHLGEQVTRSIAVCGNAAFDVTAAVCTEPWANAVAVQKMNDGRISVCDVQLTIGPLADVGRHSTILLIESNDTDRARIEVPVVVESVLPIRVTSPGAFHFQKTRPGGASAATVTPTSPHALWRRGYEIGSPRADCS